MRSLLRISPTWLLALWLVAILLLLSTSSLLVLGQLRSQTASQRRQTCYEQVRDDVEESTAIAADTNASSSDKAILEMTRARYVGEMSRCYQLDPR